MSGVKSVYEPNTINNSDLRQRTNQMKTVEIYRFHSLQTPDQNHKASPAQESPVQEERSMTTELMELMVRYMYVIRH